MKAVQSNLRVLVAQKAQKERRRISLRAVAEETGINKYTIYAIAYDRIREYPTDVLVKLCEYFNCGIGDLLLIVDVPDAGGAA